MDSAQVTTPSTAVVLPDRPRMSWEEIRQRFKNRFVLLVDLDWIERNPSFTLRSAIVLAYARRKLDALYACEIDDCYRSMSVRFTGPLTGPIPPDEPDAP